MSSWLGFLALAGFTAGLLGGVHCAAMCGGIAAVCASRTPRGSFDWRRAVAYNAGRIASYTIAGGLVGALGQASVTLRGDALAQHVLLLVAGIAMILAALYIAGLKQAVRGLEAAGRIIWPHIQPYSRAFLPADTVGRAMGLGLVWGWLPCGMVYAFLMVAMATGNALHGALITLAFGLGTAPNLLAVAVTAHRVRGAVMRPSLRIFASAAIGLLGLAALSGAAGAPLFMLNDLFCRLPGAGALH